MPTYHTPSLWRGLRGAIAATLLFGGFAASAAPTRAAALTVTRLVPTMDDGG